MPRPIPPNSSKKPFMSMEMTRTGTNSAKVTFSYQATGHVTLQQKMDMDRQSRQFIESIMEHTQHRITKIVVKEKKMELETVANTPVVPKPMSPELQQMVAEMYKTLDTHTDVYPRAPEPGEIAIPTGGLARCECSASCTKELPQPAYQILREDVDDRWKLKEEESESFAGMGRKQKHRKNKKISPKRK